MSWKQLYMNCPTPGDSGHDHIWYHNACWQKMEINDKAELRCSYHREPKSFFNWRFDCGRHHHTVSPCNRDPDFKKLLSVIACARKYSDEFDDDAWLRNLMLNITLMGSRNRIKDI